MKFFTDHFPGSRRLTAMAALLWCCSIERVAANPSAPVVTQGGAKFSTQGSQLTVTTSGNAFINWGSFNIGTGESTTFVEPTATSLVWNRINDPNPSQILGTLNANGYVVLQNASGFYIGGQAVLNTGGLIMTTAPIPPPDLTSGGAWDFAAPPPTASIINYGQLHAGTGGSIFLIANNIENHGDIIAPGGGVGLYAGKDVLVSERPDGRGLSAQVNLPQGSVDNTGRLIADAGTIAVNAQVVNQGGVIQANSIREVNGVIQLVASDAVNLGANSVISAKGDTQGASPGGTVTVQAGNSYSDAAGSTISVAGGAQGGNGGTAEISAPVMPAINSAIDGHASAGSMGGRLVIDPDFITLDESGTDSAGTGTVTAGSSTGTLDLNVDTAFTGMSQIDLQANKDINVTVNWDLVSSTGISSPGSQLTLEAGNNINFLNNANLTAGPGWSVTLEAGRNFAVANTVVPGVPNTAALGTVISGAGNITLNGTSTVETQDGSISLLAGNSIVVNGGAVRTMNGGNIDATALVGDVDADANASLNTGNFAIGGYDFGDTTAPGYSVDQFLDGISTGAGGNVSITAGGNVYSFLPAPSVANQTGGNHTDAGTGAFGPEPGNVTITAGKGVFGNYVTANGNSTITAGTSGAGNAGTEAKLLALSLVKGGWTVNAPNGGIVLQEVRNPNGDFNNSGTYKHVFDYDPAAYVNLNAGTGGGVELVGGSVPRASSSSVDNVPLVYAPTLNITAGSGGVQLDNNLTLYPSPVGNLTIMTTGGGSLFTQGGKVVNLIMSDSGASQWVANTTVFSATSLNTGDHANPVLHLNDPTLAVLNISGDMLNVGLAMPKETQISVTGNMDNCSFLGQNANANLAYDNTSITVGGRLYSRNSETFDILGQVLSPTVASEVTSSGFLNSLLDANGNQIFGSGVGLPDFTYAAGSGATPSVLGVINRFTTAQFQALVNTDASGNGISLKPLYLQLVINGQGQTVQDPNDPNYGKAIVDTAHPVTFLDLGTLNYLYQNSQDVPTKSSSGYAVGGPGTFDITAGMVDLGSSPGINSQGPAINNALAQLGSGATINLTTKRGSGTYQSGDITMFSSTISSWLGGDININAAGTVSVGSEENLGGNGLAEGIYTLGPGNINITANGTIDVAGSRIATFNGGNITLESLNGNVNAGSGAQGNINLTLYQVQPNAADPSKDKVIDIVQTFSGSGIIAYTLPSTLTSSVNGTAVTLTEPANDLPGNITILTPNKGNDPNAGNIIASEGGIVQEPLNGNESPGPTVTLTAGTQDSSGKIITPGNIDVTGSGVIGGAVTLSAAGNISGLIIGLQSTTVAAVNNISATVVSGGNASLSSGGIISGTVIAVGGISVGTGTVGGLSLVSGSVSVGGQTTSTLGPTTASSAATSAAGADSTDAKAQANGDTAETDDQKKKKGPLLARLVSRVTVMLPN
jgi:filamentous hemagglutinin family protein